MKADIRCEVSDFPLVSKHWVNILNTVAVPFSAIFDIGSFDADLLLETRCFSVWILHLYCASTAEMWTMGQLEIQKWLYRFIIFFLHLENTESVPVCTIMLPAWTMNTPFQLFFFTVEVSIWDSDRQLQSGSNPVLGWCPFSSEDLSRRKIVTKPS